MTRELRTILPLQIDFFLEAGADLVACFWAGPRTSAEHHPSLQHAALRPKRSRVTRTEGTVELDHAPVVYPCEVVLPVTQLSGSLIVAALAELMAGDPVMEVLRHLM
jgi:hypothetical protein